MPAHRSAPLGAGQMDGAARLRLVLGAGSRVASQDDGEEPFDGSSDDGPPFDAQDAGWDDRFSRPPSPSPSPSPLPRPSPLPGRFDWSRHLAGLTQRWGTVRVALTVLLVVALVGVGAGFAVGRHERLAATSAAVDSGSLPALDDGGDGFGDSSSAAAAPAAASSAGASAAAGTAGDIVVDVAGRVRHPGLVTLPPGARVADAIAAAGGVRGRVMPGAVNLAARVADGQLLVIGTHVTGAAGAASSETATDAGGDAASGGVGGSSAGTAPLDLNTATETDLEALPGIGPVLAQRILAYGQAHGGFNSVAELQQVSGIGPSHYAEISSLVTT